MSQPPNISFLPVWLHKVFLNLGMNLLGNPHSRWRQASIPLLGAGGSWSVSRGSCISECIVFKWFNVLSLNLPVLTLPICHHIICIIKRWLGDSTFDWGCIAILPNTKLSVVTDCQLSLILKWCCIYYLLIFFLKSTSGYTFLGWFKMYLSVSVSLLLGNLCWKKKSLCSWSVWYTEYPVFKCIYLWRCLCGISWQLIRT